MKKYATGIALFLILNLAGPLSARQSAAHPAPDNKAGPAAAWLEFAHDMETMHSDMMSIKQSDSSDVDFARLMLPHHQAAIEMAKTELIYGKDPQMRRLAQEIVTDQLSEIELMRLWLKQHETGAPK